MKLKIYQVDAFARGAFTGNPAAVVPLKNWLDDDKLLAIAEENNLSETAFVIGEGEDWKLRWFTPAAEVALCGHATLAAAHAIFEFLERDVSELRFATRQSGTLIVARRDDGLALDFPSLPPEQIEMQADVTAALGAKPSALLAANYSPTERDLLAVFEQEADVVALAPDFAGIASIPTRGIICTAPGKDVDFVSRYFAPAVGVPEDPFTGSAHCILTAYWAERFAMKQLSACQISRRQGWATCTLVGDRVQLLGEATTFMTGQIYL